MAVSRRPLHTEVFVCSGAVPAFTAVKLVDADTVIAAAAAETDKVIGICGPVAGADGGRAEITLLGAEQMLAGGTIAVGDAITPTTGGKGIAAVGTATHKGYAVGQAMTAAASGGTIVVFVRPYLWTVNSA